MRSIIDKLGSNVFPRIKIGIGRPRDGNDVVGHVLNNFAADEKDHVDEALSHAVDAVRAVLALGLEKAQSGIRVDQHGEPIKPKGSHQNGKAKRKKGSLNGDESEKAPSDREQHVSETRPIPSSAIESQ